jgi:hypothetical protein
VLLGTPVAAFFRKRARKFRLGGNENIPSKHSKFESHSPVEAFSQRQRYIYTKRDHKYTFMVRSGSNLFSKVIGSNQEKRTGKNGKKDSYCSKDAAPDKSSLEA